MALTVMQVLDRTANKYGDRAAMAVKRNGQWVKTSWNEYRAAARRAARAFIHLGVEPKTGVSIIGYNSPEWFIADAGAILAGGFPAGIYTTNSAEQCQYIADHSDSAVAVVEDATQLAKFQSVRDGLPKLKAIVLMSGDDPADDVYSWKDFLALADQVPESTLDERIAAQQPDDVCTLIYTSGTTGPPKAVMISHDNITFVAQCVSDLVSGGPDDVMLSYLPLSHIAEQAITLHGPMWMGATTYFAESLDLLGDNLREVRPTVFLGVPRVWEKIQAKMVAAGKQNSPLKKKIAAWARKVGLASRYAEQEGKPFPFTHAIASKLVFSKVRERLGLDRCRLQVTSAAPISKDTLEFFLSLDIPLFEVYGMSECTGPATISLPGRYRTGKAGFCLPGAELKIAEDGEVCMRGRHVFKGYYKNPEATAEALDSEGWLHSGDIGVIDPDGFLRITDRKKDLIITAGGENVAPQLIEGQIKAIPVVAQAVVIGDRRKFLSALLVLDSEQVAATAEALGSPARTSAQAAECPKFRAHLQQELDELNKSLARVQTIKKFTILPEEFSIEGGEMTPTMKVKRKVVNEKYSGAIETMYA
ncbi:MAG: AMP-binding protein [Deltaproteobacteria bacterium]|nr:AMP-binding protein [Deltaproteobacteria bacterium]MCB9785781.1 AMP-binding protein [Deltaproteobacteria bacterium]